jgi:hypothetical protein
MKPKLLLRLAGVVMLMHTIGHTMGALTWDHAPNKPVANVLAGMKAEHFDFFGRQVTIAMFYQGYGYSMIGVLLLISVILWRAGSYVNDKMTQSILPFIGIFLIIFAIIEWIYFFPMPAALSSVAAMLTLMGHNSSRALKQG